MLGTHLLVQNCLSAAHDRPCPGALPAAAMLHGRLIAAGRELAATEPVAKWPAGSILHLALAEVGFEELVARCLASVSVSVFALFALNVVIGHMLAHGMLCDQHAVTARC